MSNEKRRYMLVLSVVLLFGGYGMNRYGARQQRIYGSSAKWVQQGREVGRRENMKILYSTKKVPASEYGKGWYVAGSVCMTIGAGLIAFGLHKTKDDAKQ